MKEYNKYDLFIEVWNTGYRSLTRIEYLDYALESSKRHELKTIAIFKIKLK